MAYILSLATASPKYCFQQEQIVDRLTQELELSSERQEQLKKLYKNSAISTRRSVMENFDLLFSEPTPNERNDIYKEQAPKLAIEAAKKALDQWGEAPEKITHIISVSCTGMMAPGLECFIIQELALRPNVRRTAINFMGCCAAFNALAVARSIAREDASHYVLLVCTELCSLHGQVDLSSDSLLANALFADGSAACVIGRKRDNYLWEIMEQSSFLLENTQKLMSWDVAESGYAMKLSLKVPVIIKKNIISFVKSIVHERNIFEECDWAIHPGGKDILQAIEKACSLLPWQTDASWQTLRENGNMSSATFLFVLQRLLKKRSQWALGLGFGPGLAMEGILLRRH